MLTVSASCCVSNRQDPAQWRAMYRRRKWAGVLLAVLLVLTLIASAFPALADGGSSSGSETGLGLTDEEITNISIPPMPSGVSAGTRVYVRTRAVNATEYLVIRAEIYDLGFEDVLEVAPGTVVVAIGDRSFDDAAAMLLNLRGVTDVVPAPTAQAGTPRDYPVVWVVLIASLLAATALVIAVRRRPA